MIIRGHSFARIYKWRLRHGRGNERRHANTGLFCVVVFRGVGPPVAHVPGGEERVTLLGNDKVRRAGHRGSSFRQRLPIQRALGTQVFALRCNCVVTLGFGLSVILCRIRGEGCVTIRFQRDRQRPPTIRHREICPLLTLSGRPSRGRNHNSIGVGSDDQRPLILRLWFSWTLF